LSKVGLSALDLPAIIATLQSGHGRIGGRGSGGIAHARSQPKRYTRVRVCRSAQNRTPAKIKKGIVMTMIASTVSVVICRFLPKYGFKSITRLWEGALIWIKADMHAG
jgi:hypothetical protein